MYQPISFAKWTDEQVQAFVVELTTEKQHRSEMRKQATAAKKPPTGQAQPHGPKQVVEVGPRGGQIVRVAAPGGRAEYMPHNPPPPPEDRHGKPHPHRGSHAPHHGINVQKLEDDELDQHLHAAQLELHHRQQRAMQGGGSTAGPQSQQTSATTAGVVVPQPAAAAPQAPAVKVLSPEQIRTGGQETMRKIRQEHAVKPAVQVAGAGSPVPRPTAPAPAPQPGLPAPQKVGPQTTAPEQPRIKPKTPEERTAVAPQTAQADPNRPEVKAYNERANAAAAATSAAEQTTADEDDPASLRGFHEVHTHAHKAHGEAAKFAKAAGMTAEAKRHEDTAARHLVAGNAAFASAETLEGQRAQEDEERTAATPAKPQLSVIQGGKGQAEQAPAAYQGDEMSQKQTADAKAASEQALKSGLPHDHLRASQQHEWAATVHHGKARDAENRGDTVAQKFHGDQIALHDNAKMEHQRTAEASIPRPKDAEFDKVPPTLESHDDHHKRTGKKAAGHALGSRNMKRHLEHLWPGMKFSVSSKTFSGGDSIDADWEDGPRQQTADRVIDKYGEVDFDGSTDSTNYRHNPHTEKYGGAHYTHGSREMSAGTKGVLEAWAKQHLESDGQPHDAYAHLQLAQELFGHTELPVGAKVTGVEPGGTPGAERGIARDFHVVYETAKGEAKEKPAASPMGGVNVVEPGTVALTGDTFPHKRTIREMGGRWDKDAKAWKLSQSDYNKHQDRIEGLHGVKAMGAAATATGPGAVSLADTKADRLTRLADDASKKADASGTEEDHWAARVAHRNAHEARQTVLRGLTPGEQEEYSRNAAIADRHSRQHQHHDKEIGKAREREASPVKAVAPKTGDGATVVEPKPIAGQAALDRNYELHRQIDEVTKKIKTAGRTYEGAQLHDQLVDLERELDKVKPAAVAAIERQDAEKKGKVGGLIVAGSDEDLKSSSDHAYKMSEIAEKHGRSVDHLEAHKNHSLVAQKYDEAAQKAEQTGDHGDADRYRAKAHEHRLKAEYHHGKKTEAVPREKSEQAAHPAAQEEKMRAASGQQPKPLVSVERASADHYMRADEASAKAHEMTRAIREKRSTDYDGTASAHEEAAELRRAASEGDKGNATEHLDFEKRHRDLAQRLRGMAAKPQEAPAVQTVGPKAEAPARGPYQEGTTSRDVSADADRVSAVAAQTPSEATHGSAAHMQRYAQQMHERIAETQENLGEPHFHPDGASFHRTRAGEHARKAETHEQELARLQKPAETEQPIAAAMNEHYQNADEASTRAMEASSKAKESGAHADLLAAADEHDKAYDAHTGAMDGDPANKDEHQERAEKHKRLALKNRADAAAVAPKPVEQAHAPALAASTPQVQVVEQPIKPQGITRPSRAYTKNAEDAQRTSDAADARLANAEHEPAIEVGRAALDARNAHRSAAGTAHHDPKVRDWHRDQAQKYDAISDEHYKRHADEDRRATDEFFASRDHGQKPAGAATVVTPEKPIAAPKPSPAEFTLGGQTAEEAAAAEPKDKDVDPKEAEKQRQAEAIENIEREFRVVHRGGAGPGISGWKAGLPAAMAAMKAHRAGNVQEAITQAAKAAHASHAWATFSNTIHTANNASMDFGPRKVGPVAKPAEALTLGGEYVPQDQREGNLLGSAGLQRPKGAPPSEPKPAVTTVEPKAEATPKRVSMAGAEFDVVKKNVDGTYTLRNEQGAEFDTTAADASHIKAAKTKPETTTKALDPRKMSREEYIKASVAQIKGTRAARLHAAQQNIEAWEPAKPLPVGISKLQVLQAKERPTEHEKAILREHRLADAAHHGDYRTDEETAGRVHDQITGKREGFTPAGGAPVQPKEPWQVPLSEWMKREHNITESHGDSYYHPESGSRVLYPGVRGPRVVAALHHTHAVEIALAEGKDVPPEVLREHTRITDDNRPRNAYEMRDLGAEIASKASPKSGYVPASKREPTGGARVVSSENAAPQFVQVVEPTSEPAKPSWGYQAAATDVSLAQKKAEEALANTRLSAKKRASAALGAVQAHEHAAKLAEHDPEVEKRHLEIAAHYRSEHEKHDAKAKEEEAKKAATFVNPHASKAAKAKEAAEAASKEAERFNTPETHRKADEAHRRASAAFEMANLAERESDNGSDEAERRYANESDEHTKRGSEHLTKARVLEKTPPPEPPEPKAPTPEPEPPAPKPAVKVVNAPSLELGGQTMKEANETSASRYQRVAESAWDLWKTAEETGRTAETTDTPEAHHAAVEAYRNAQRAHQGALSAGEEFLEARGGGRKRGETAALKHHENRAMDASAAVLKHEAAKKTAGKNTAALAEKAHAASTKAFETTDKLGHYGTIKFARDALAESDKARRLSQSAKTAEEHRAAARQHARARYGHENAAENHGSQRSSGAWEDIRNTMEHGWAKTSHESAGRAHAAAEEYHERRAKALGAPVRVIKGKDWTAASEPTVTEQPAFEPKPAVGVVEPEKPHHKVMKDADYYSERAMDYNRRQGLDAFDPATVAETHSVAARKYEDGARMAREAGDYPAAKRAEERASLHRENVGQWHHRINELAAEKASRMADRMSALAKKGKAPHSSARRWHDDAEAAHTVAAASARLVGGETAKAYKAKHETTAALHTKAKEAHAAQETDRTLADHEAYYNATRDAREKAKANRERLAGLQNRDPEKYRAKFLAAQEEEEQAVKEMSQAGMSYQLAFEQDRREENARKPR